MSNSFRDWTPEMVEAYNRRNTNGPKINLPQGGQPPVEKRDVRDEPDGAAQNKEALSTALFRLAESLWSIFPGVREVLVGHSQTKKKYLVIVIDHRKKLIDEDNLEAKWAVDCLRYVKWIPEDNPATCKTIVTQYLAEKDEDVGLQIEIIEL